MTAGRKPKPTAIKRLAGNPGQRPLNDSEPAPSSDAPDMPDFLDAAGQAAWEWLVGELRTMRILASSDLAVMSIYCVTWSQFVAASRRLATMGESQFLLKSEKNGTYYPNPMLSAQTGCKNQLVKIATELGLSPTSRTRLHAAPQQQTAGGKDRFFKVVG